MEVKENRPDACAASGTANSIYKDFSTDAPDIQEELTGPVLPDECAADIVSFCSEQTIAYDDLLEYATLFYLQDKDPEDPPFRDTLKFELLTLTNRCIDAYNFGKRDPNAAPGAKLKDAYPDKKEGAERYKRLSGLHTLQIAIILYKLHHAVGILWNNSHDDGNFDIGIYQYSGDNEGCYDVGEQNLKSLIRGYCKTGTIKDVNETIEALRAICPRVERCRNRDLVAVNNGIYDYGNKILMAFDPAFVFTSKKHVDFVDRARNPVIHNNEDGTDWDVVSWMNELSDDPDVVSLLWQIIGATVALFPFRQQRQGHALHPASQSLRTGRLDFHSVEELRQGFHAHVADACVRDYHRRERHGHVRGRRGVAQEHHHGRPVPDEPQEPRPARRAFQRFHGAVRQRDSEGSG